MLPLRTYPQCGAWQRFPGNPCRRGVASAPAGRQTRATLRPPQSTVWNFTPPASMVVGSLLAVAFMASSVPGSRPGDDSLEVGARNHHGPVARHVEPLDQRLQLGRQDA